MKISPELSENINYLDDLFKDCGDVVSRRFPIGTSSHLDLYIIYIDDMVNRDVIDFSVMQTLLIEIRKVPPTLPYDLTSVKDIIKNGGITTADISEENDLDKAVTEVLSGNTLLLIDGCSTAIILSTRGYASRGVTEADTEIAVQGSKESFSESLRTNTVLLRRRIRDTNLKLKHLKIGRRSKTDIVISYIDDIVRR
ncbi:MAG: spore germination protein, partial [Firmicutes bacterium]|nr:spore germination protein [Bacillota bacterium]